MSKEHDGHSLRLVLLTMMKSHADLKDSIKIREKDAIFGGNDC